MIAKTVNFVSSLSPDVEQFIYQGDNDDYVFNYITNVRKFLENAKNIVIFVININLVNILKDRNRKFIFLFQMFEDDRDSRLIIYKNKINQNCCLDDTSQLIENFNYVIYFSNYLTYSLCEKREPITVAENRYSISRIPCDKCSPNHACTGGWNGTTITFADLENNFDIWKTFAEKSLSSWFFDADNFSKNDIKLLAFLSAVFVGYDKSVILMSQSLEMSDSFLQDIIGQNKENILNASLCMLRAIAFPPAKSPHKVMGSVDWHVNSPRVVRGFKSDLYRVDVVDFEKFGIIKSGASRMLFAIDGMRKVFIAFTDAHDFPYNFYEERLREVSNDEGKLR